MATKPVKSTEIEIIPIKRGKVTFCLLSETPYIFNSMSLKSSHELLAPSGRKTAAQKAVNLKHDPVKEFRASVLKDYTGGPTHLAIDARAFKGAISTAAIDMPTSVAKSQINRMVRVPGESISVWGVPKLFMTTVRSADMNRTPDIRTRARMTEWCCKVTLSYTEPMLNHNTLAALLAFAGQVIGVGDFRQEKGKGDFGLFNIVNEDDPDFQRIMATGGRDAQVAAMLAAEPIDAASEELLDWFTNEYLPSRGLTSSADEDDEVAE